MGSARSPVVLLRVPAVGGAVLPAVTIYGGVCGDEELGSSDLGAPSLL